MVEPGVTTASAWASMFPTSMTSSRVMYQVSAGKYRSTYESRTSGWASYLRKCSRRDQGWSRQITWGRPGSCPSSSRRTSSSIQHVSSNPGKKYPTVANSRMGRSGSRSKCSASFSRGHSMSGAK